MGVWQQKKAGELVKFRTGKLDSNAAEEGGKYPFFTCAQQTYRINSYAFDTECALLAGNNAAGIFPLKYFSGKFNAYQRTYVIEPKDKSELSARYFYYYLRPLLKAFEQQATGVTTKFLTLKILNSFIVSFPQFAAQRKIAAILTAYDDLIETNKRRIALLEKMAEELYREWFVRMRFPGHQKTKFVKGVPEGWPFDLGTTFFDHVKGKSYSSHEISNEEGSCFFITLKSFYRRGGYRKEGLKFYSGSYKEGQCVQSGDVVMAVTDMTQDRAVVGEVARIPSLPGKKSVISLDVIRLIPKDMSTTFLYAYMRHSGFANYIKEFANGANVLHLKPDLVGKQRLLFPPKELRAQFSDLAEPIYEATGRIEAANEAMAQTRDLLLPRLISGKLSVEDLDIQFPPSMQEKATEPAVAHA